MQGTTKASWYRFFSSILPTWTQESVSGWYSTTWQWTVCSSEGNKAVNYFHSGFMGTRENYAPLQIGWVHLKSGDDCLGKGPKINKYAIHAYTHGPVTGSGPQ